MDELLKEFDMPYRTELDQAFIIARVCVSDSGCWIWQRSLDRHGYGLLGPGATERLAHRLSFRLFRGDIPDDMTVDHICFQTNCVNPDHLQLLTRPENTKRKLDRKGKPRQIPTYTPPPPQTHCKRGHEYTPENTLVSGHGGTRDCRECSLIRRREAHAAARR